MIKATPIFRRHFTFKHPLFRAQKTATGVKWQDSIYYLWWEWLRRHEGYRQTCEDDGVGKYGKLYADFGDVHGVDFKTWWNTGERGARLFAEPGVVVTVSELSSADIFKMKDSWDDASQIIIAIPLAFPKRAIIKRIREILKKRHVRKRGQRLMKESKALYPISAQFNFHSLKTALDVYDLHSQKRGLKQWEIAQELRFTTTLKENELGKRGSAGATDKKAAMSVAVSRKLAQAKRIIDGVGRGQFPAL